MPEKNREYDMTAEDLTIDGMGVGRIDGMAVFAEGLLPGERGRVLVIKKAKKYAVAKTLEVYETSPDRVKPQCGVFQQCGGCSLMHLRYEAQLAYKQGRVSRLLAVNGGVSVPPEDILPSPQMLRYRNKTAFPVKQGKEGLLIGCYAKRSHRVVNTEQCLLQHPDADKALQIIRRWMEENEISAYDEERHQGLVRHVVVRRSSLGEMMVGLVVNGKGVPKERELGRQLQAALPQVKTLVINSNQTRGNVILGRETRPILGDGRIAEQIGGLGFRISLNTFLQINHAQMEKMYDTVMKLAQIGPEDVVADLYCGAGTMSLYSALLAKRVYGVEIVPEAVQDARDNAKANGIENATFFCGDCKEAFRRILRQEGRLDVVIVDPPRKGLDNQVLEDIAESGADKVAYVSCDPATLARDVKILQERAYQVQKIQPLDLFPMSTHVETVVLLSKLKVDHHIEIELKMDELDLTAAESKATYDEIKAYVLNKYGLKVSQLYIAQIKRKCGIIERKNYNVSKKEDAKVPQCPPEKEAAIMDALKHFQMI